MRSRTGCCSAKGRAAWYLRASGAGIDLDDDQERVRAWDGYSRLPRQNRQVQEVDSIVIEFGDRPLYDWLRGACDEYLANPPPADWNGVTKFTTK